MTANISLETVITFATPKEEEDGDDGIWKQGNLHNNIYKDISGDYAKQCRDPFDFAALAVLVSNQETEPDSELLLTYYINSMPSKRCWRTRPIPISKSSVSLSELFA